MIAINNLDFSYRKTRVFQNLTIGFPAGKIYGIMGKNGTGKSTLLSAISGLLQPNDGTISVLGYNPFNRGPAFLSNVFLVPEEFYMPDISVKEFVRFYRPFYPKFSNAMFDDFLTQFSIDRLETLQKMSYGQKKKILISFALACNTAVLLMDEPTNGLDVVSKAQFKKIIAGAFANDKCFIISTHQVRDIENLVDQVCFIDAGNIVFNESIDAISRTLQFRISHDPTEDTLFREESILGEAVIVHGTAGAESKVDLELLYKAISENPEKIYSAFKNQL